MMIVVVRAPEAWKLGCDDDPAFEAMFYVDNCSCLTELKRLARLVIRAGSTIELFLDITPGVPYCWTGYVEYP